MKQKWNKSIENYYFIYFSDIKYVDSSQLVAAALTHALGRRHVALLIWWIFTTRTPPKSNLTTWTNIIALFMNTVKHFVQISTQKRDNPKESCEADKLMFTMSPFFLQLWFHGGQWRYIWNHGSDWLNRLNPHDLFLADWPLIELSFDTACVGTGGVDFMDGCVNSFIRT